MLKISKNIKDTEEIAKEFFNKILKNKNMKNATVVTLSGDLGAGKTSFTQLFAKHFGIKKKVNSPTFVVMKRYPLPLLRGSAQRARGCIHSFKNLFHLDAYRLKNHKELLHLGWAEIIKNPENIIFIEWPENVAKAMPKKHHKISIAHTKEGHRKFKIKML
ncbi:tRNA (adenosine(37)-N6)-threonylcarbamoyltransferase complex ATPase subunit type 1 TsaE [Candidatus Nomurabacteria bacterium]|nr:tRNA (adenosine(37)-N6)-threonylcarbamoyltransferase complex ATPase subunit type 1 TsaE [Candidatus Nomurabacteria bacterium]